MAETDIYALFTDRRVITVQDDQGRSTRVLLIKPTWHVRRDAFECFEQSRLTEQQRLQAARYAEILHEQFQQLTRAQLTQEIVADRGSAREQLLDLYPLLDETTLTPDERTAQRRTIFEEWQTQQRELLAVAPMDDLIHEMAQLTLKRKATLVGLQQSNFFQLMKTCLDPDTEQPLFPSIEAVGRLDMRVIDQLVTAMNALIAVHTGADIRAAADAPDFFDSGTSPKPVDAIPPLTTGTS